MLEYKSSSQAISSATIPISGITDNSSNLADLFSARGVSTRTCTRVHICWSKSLSVWGPKENKENKKQYRVLLPVNAQRKETWIDRKWFDKEDKRGSFFCEIACKLYRKRFLFVIPEIIDFIRQPGSGSYK